MSTFAERYADPNTTREERDAMYQEGIRHGSRVLEFQDGSAVLTTFWGNRTERDAYRNVKEAIAAEARKPQPAICLFPHPKSPNLKF